MSSLDSGMCTNSYGLNVARLAEIPQEVIRSAAAKANDLRAHLSSKTEGKQKTGEMGAAAAGVIRAIASLTGASQIVHALAFWSQHVIQHFNMGQP